VGETHSIWCHYEISLEVRDGQVVTGTITAYPGPAQDCGAYTKGIVNEPLALSEEDAARWTVPGLFQEAYRWAAWTLRPDMEIKLEFDPELGYPQRIFHDHKTAVDDEGGLSVSQFERLGP
jgi:hypothetical protein